MLNACLACRILVRCTEIHLSILSRPVGDRFTGSCEEGIGRAISEILVTIRSVFFKEIVHLVRKAKAGVCVCGSPVYLLRMVCTSYFGLT